MIKFEQQIYHCVKHGEVEVQRAYRYDEYSRSKYYLFDASCPMCISEKESAEQERQIEELQRVEAETRIRQAKMPSRFNDATFESYVTRSSGQKKNLDVCKRYADNFQQILKDGKGLLLIGSVGTGKTHLACAIAHQICIKGFSARYDTLSGIIRNIRSTWTGERKTAATPWQRERTITEQDVIEHYCSFDLLIIDEIGVQSGTENERNLIFNIIDERYQDRLPTIAISNLTEKELAPLISERSIDRLKEGSGTLVFNWDSYRKAA